MYLSHWSVNTQESGSRCSEHNAFVSYILYFWDWVQYFPFSWPHALGFSSWVMTTSSAASKARNPNGLTTFRPLLCPTQIGRQIFFVNMPWFYFSPKLHSRDWRKEDCCLPFMPQKKRKPWLLQIRWNYQKWNIWVAQLNIWLMISGSWVQAPH